MTEDLGLHMFALIIGIDIYESNAIPRLRGAVADARALKAYLLHTLNVPQDHITILENESATRAAIIAGLQHLAKDPRIQPGDPIIIFYAGHGSEAAAPLSWDAGGPNANIQLTLPYDVFCSIPGGKEVEPIPDRTFGALLEAIAREKGDNIVVVIDSCHSASGTRSLPDNPSNLIRSVPLPSTFQLQENIDQDLLRTNVGLRSYVLLSACSPFGEAWESNGRGVFTVALLKFLECNQIDKLRYSDIVMRMNIDPRQSPHCEGLNQERCIFTTTSPPQIEYFMLAYTRTKKNGPFAYILSGGSAHGLVVGDEFAIYPDLDSEESAGTLVIDKVGPFYSIMRLAEKGFPVTGNAVAIRGEGGKRQPLSIYCRLKDKIVEPLSRLHDKDHDLPAVVVVDAAEDDFSAILRSGNMVASNCCIEPTAEELACILESSSQFLSEFDCIADFPDITQHVKVDIYELQRSRSQFPGVPTVEPFPWSAASCRKDAFALRQGTSYGLKLTNNSPYDLFPIVQHFNPGGEFMFDTWYQPASSRSMVDVPLQKGGGTLVVCHEFGSASRVIPFSPGHGFGFLKVSLFTRPLHPFYQSELFRLAPYLPECLEGQWGTIIKPVTHLPSSTQSPLSDSQQSFEGFIPDKPRLINKRRSFGLYLVLSNSRSSILNLDEKMSVLSSVTGLLIWRCCPIEIALPSFLRNSNPGILKRKQARLKLLWKRFKNFIRLFLVPGTSQRPKQASRHCIHPSSGVQKAFQAFSPSNGPFPNSGSATFSK